MLPNIFKKGGSGGRKRPSVDMVLDRLSKMGPSSANCTLIKTKTGEEANEGLGQAFLFKYEEDLLVQNKAFYISTPDGIKAEDRSVLSGKDEILNLWFLFNRVPYTMDCRLMGRIRFPDNIRGELDPRMPQGYMVRPVGEIKNLDKRMFLRYAHKPGRLGTRVYSQIMFDLFITKTDVTYPDTGSLPNHISDLHLLPFSSNNELPAGDPDEIVKFMKDAIRLNPREQRVVYVSKPHMDERTNKVSLVDLDASDVLGLETSKESSRTFYIRKPPRMSSTKGDPGELREGDVIQLGFHTRISGDAPSEYYDIIAEVNRIGTENMTVRSNGDMRTESGIPTDLLDFSVGGVKIESSKELLTYLLGPEHEEMDFQEKIDNLESFCYLLDFYPKLRFNRETEGYQPELPMRIQTLAKVVRTEVSKPKEEGDLPEITAFGFKFYYDPIEYSRDTYSYDKWELIRQFKESKYFREIHKALNGLIGYLESQNR